MAFFVVIEEQGPGWDPKRVMQEQKGWTDHANFMDTLETEHFVVLGGPLKYKGGNWVPKLLTKDYAQSVRTSTWSLSIATRS